MGEATQVDLKDHSTWSASATAGNWACAGRLALCEGQPDDTNQAADWGTVAHDVSEQCLTEGTNPIDYQGEVRKGKKFSFEVDEEMVEICETYVGYVRSRAAEAGGTDLMSVENRFSLAALNPPFDAGGTADAVIYFPKQKLLEVVDLKTGRGVKVGAKDNKQLRTYALGAFMANEKGRSVSKIKSTIIQPRVYREPLTDEFHTADLIEWTSELLDKMNLSKQARDEYQAVKAGDMSMGEWQAKWLSPGDHCHSSFCKARAFCPALEQKALDTAGVWFDDLDQPRISNQPDALSPERAAQILDAADMISDWINAVRAYWHEQAEMGVEIPNYVLVPKQGREKWDEGAEAEAAKLAVKAGVPEEKVFNAPKIRTPKQVRAELAKIKATKQLIDAISGMSSTPETGSNLVRADKTTRSPVKPKVEQHFDILD